MFGVTAVSRVRAALDSAVACQEPLNIFTSIDHERAIERALLIDQTIESGKYAGPLAGVPIALKDLIDQEGAVTTCGSAFYRQTAEWNAPCVAALEEAGGVIIGRTGLHEWAFGFSSENPHWGPVRNPWDPETSPGGSSGGSAAAVAAGIAPISIGTDTGGSVRVPAALCGTYGLKVTYGRVPLDGVFPLVASIDSVGPLADSIENLDLAYRAMSGDRTPEPASRKLQLAVPQPWYADAPLETEVREAFMSAVDSLRELGHEVHAMDLPEVWPSRQLWNAIALEVRSVHGEFRREGRPYGEDVATRLDDAETVTSEEAAAAREWQGMIRTRFSDALSTVDFLLTPTVPVRRKVIGEDTIAGRHYRAVLSYFSALVNHSLLPALAMPLADSGSPPASIQCIGGLESESSLIAFGRELERAGVTEFRPAPGNSPKQVRE